MIQNKGKSVTTSFPSIRFHANAEKLEELYASDEEAGGEAKFITTTNIEETPNSSPLRTYLPKLIKRSSSVDVAPAQDSSPPDRWRFFQDIKGKITKTVEGKITEIKSRGLDDGSPKKCKDGKESDSEDLSESSISRTCGVASTTEAEAEMSSDEDTASLDKDEKEASTSRSDGVRYRLINQNSNVTEGEVPIESLHNLYTAATDHPRIGQRPRGSGVESGIEVLEDSDFNFPLDDDDSAEFRFGDDSVQIAQEILDSITDQIDNVSLEDGTFTVREVSGSDLMADVDSGMAVYAPSGFVDMRRFSAEAFKFPTVVSVMTGFLLLYFLVQLHSVYLSGVMVGVAATLAILGLYRRFLWMEPVPRMDTAALRRIIEYPAVKEYQPITKFEGWINEFPEEYDPLTYHVSQTQTVFLRLQGNLLRVSHTRTKIPKRAVFNEHIHRPHFTYHRIYNLRGATISLLPQGLAKVRHWSKKYPICITLHREHMNFDYVSGKDKVAEGLSNTSLYTSERRKKKETLAPQRFSKLTEENENFDIDFEEHPQERTPDEPQDTAKTETDLIEEELQKIDLQEDAESGGKDDLESIATSVFITEDKETGEPLTKLYFFGRTGREKEDWFRRFAKATHRGSLKTATPGKSTLNVTPGERVSTVILDDFAVEKEYLKTVLRYCKYSSYWGPTREYSKVNAAAATKKTDDTRDDTWLNVILARIMFDCTREPPVINRIKDRIQRKLNSVKLPYFIEGLIIEDLDLGTGAPIILRIYPPQVDERGLWIDMDISYDGTMTFIVQTKLNLMKLKNHKEIEEQKRREPQRLAMYHSDVDDSAESTTDEESAPQPSVQPAQVLDEKGVPVAGLGGTSKQNKKFIKIVDKIADSKLFQAASENKYIKNLMEGVSKTDLRLKVEVKSLVGTLVLNFPPPPSDRLWIGFRPLPVLQVSAQPIVGERNVTASKVTGWIERKLVQEFQKVMVLPNMEDISVPVMCSKLPE